MSKYTISNLICAEAIKRNGYVRNISLQEAKLDSKIVDKLRDLFCKYGKSIYTLGDLQKLGGYATLEKYFDDKEMLAIMGVLQTYGLELDDELVTDYGSSYALRKEFQNHSFDALDQCSLIDFLPGSRGMEIISETIISEINIMKNSMLSTATSVEEIEKIHLQIENMMTMYRNKVAQMRVRLYESLDDEASLEFYKHYANRHLCSELDELKKFHHSPRNHNIDGERVHSYNPYSTDDSLL